MGVVTSIMPYLTIGKWIGGLLGGLAIAWIVYAGLIRPVTKPNPSTSQEATNMENFNTAPRVGIGCIHIVVKPEEKK